MASPSDLGDKAGAYGRQVIQNVRSIAGYSGVGVVLGLGFGCLVARTWDGVGIVAIAALACYAIGSAFGFLFSIPRSAQVENAAATATIATSDRKKIIPRDNTNLEQISDWLVKILIGAGLVQLDKVAGLLQGSAARLGRALMDARQAADPVRNAAANASDSSEFCLFLILYFLMLGFLTGYLITKLWLPYVMLRSALAMEYLQLEADEDAARKQGAREALRSFGLTTMDNPPGATAETRAMAKEAYEDDPNKGQFGGRPEANGLKLTAEVTKMDDIDEDYFRVTLKVTTNGTRTLVQAVTFHLHPTFPVSEVPVLPINNEAVLVRAAWGAFTVGVTVAGEDTKLELDLAELPGVPSLFKSR